MDSLQLKLIKHEQYFLTVEITNEINAKHKGPSNNMYNRKPCAVILF